MVKRYKTTHYGKETDLSAGVRFIIDRIKKDNINLDEIDRLSEQARAIDGMSNDKPPSLK
jgi:hypothetical protein